MGPWEVLASWTRGHPEDGYTVSCLSRDGEPVRCAKGLTVAVDHSFATAPAYDVLLHPGGRGTRPQLEDEAHLAWVRGQRATASLMTSVCTGSLVYAAAGLLNGRPATTPLGGPGPARHARPEHPRPARGTVRRRRRRHHRGRRLRGHRHGAAPGRPPRRHRPGPRGAARYPVRPTAAGLAGVAALAADGHLPALDVTRPQRADHLLDRRLRDLHEREPVGDLDGADLPSAQAGLVRRSRRPGPVGGHRRAVRARRTGGSCPRPACGCVPGRPCHRAAGGPPAAPARAAPERRRGISSSSSTGPPLASWASLTAASATSMTSNSSVSVSTTTRNCSKSSSSRLSCSAARVSSRRRARRSATVGIFSTAIRRPVTRSMVLSIRCSRGPPG